VLKLIVQVLLAIIVFRLLGSLVGMFRSRDGNRAKFEGSRPNETVDHADYRELTPYEIEDAEYEDLPKRD
jgi:hypothetical protein